MPNVIDIPLTDLENLEISPNKAYVKFRKNQSEIEVSSEVGKGIIIESKHKSELGSIAINDNFLASLTFYSKSFPFYLAMSLICLFSTLILLVTATDVEQLIIAFIVLIISIIFIILFFTSKTARLSFRLTNEQDYHILLGGLVISKHKKINKFIQKALQNSLKVMNGNGMSNHSQSVRKGPPL